MLEHNTKTPVKMLDKLSGFDKPLLPESLRRVWSAEPLPKWVEKDLGLPEGSTFAALEVRIPHPESPAVPLRVYQFIANKMLSKKGELEPVRVLSRPWPPALLPSTLPWKVRTRRCLDRAGLLNNRVALSDVTFGQLFSLPNMGVQSVLDFAWVAEIGINRVTESGCAWQAVETTDTQRFRSDTLMSAVSSPWANQVSARDPRFADLLPPGDGTIFERIDQLTRQPQDDPREEQALAEAVVRVRQKIQELSGLPLDLALADFMSSLSGLEGRKLEALLARFGWGGNPPLTLEAAGSLVGVTRERMRQLQNRVTACIPEHPVFMPSLDQALEIIARKAPLDFNDAGRMLHNAGITSVDFHPRSLQLAAEACGRAISFQLDLDSGHGMVVTGKHTRYATQVISLARRQAQASGVSNVQEVVAEAKMAHVDVSEDDTREVLTQLSKLRFLEGDWFWNPYGKQDRNRLRNMTRRMLSVASPISVLTLREGVRRAYRYRTRRRLGTWPLIVPPRSVLRCFLETNPEFLVEQNDLVSPVAPLDYRVELGATEQVLVDVLRSSPACVLDRASFAKECARRGMNQNTFSIYLSYSVVIAHLDNDIWSLRGVRVDPAAVEAVRASNAVRPREKRVIDHGWTPEGSLWVAARLPRLVSSFVFGIPGAIKRFVAGRKFAAMDEEGTPYGTIRVSEDGASFGYGPFLSRRGGDEDDILITEFDLARHSAVLRLGDDEMLEEWNPTTS